LPLELGARAAALFSELCWACLVDEVEEAWRGACTIVELAKREGSRARTGTRLGDTDIPRPRCAIIRDCLVPGIEDDELEGRTGGNGASVVFCRVVMSETLVLTGINEWVDALWRISDILK